MREDVVPMWNALHTYGIVQIFYQKPKMEKNSSYK